MNTNGFVVDIQLFGRPGTLKAFANVTIELPEGSLVLLGFKVFQKDGKPPVVFFPSKEGKKEGNWFPVVTAKGEIKDRLTESVLDAYQKAKAA